MGTFSGMNGGLHGVASPPASRLKSQLSFSSRLPSTLNILPQISEIESNEITTSPTATKLGNGNVDSPLYNNGFSYGSWNDPYQFNIMKTEEDYETKLFPGTQVLFLVYGVRFCLLCPRLFYLHEFFLGCLEWRSWEFWPYAISSLEFACQDFSGKVSAVSRYCSLQD